jgi:hypothetical protein
MELINNIAKAHGGASLFGGVEKFDSKNNFSLYLIKIRALLRQEGLVKILMARHHPSKEVVKLEEKVHSVILLSFSNGVLRGRR